MTDESLVAGSCFGFGIESELDLLFLRNGSGDTLRVDTAPSALADFEPGEPLLRWDQSQGHAVTASLWQPDDGLFDLDVDGGGWFRIDTRNRHVVVPDHGDPVRREERLWGFPSLLMFLERGELPLHGAAVEHEGRALILSAPSRHGKTTLSLAFHLFGHRLLAEDLSCVRFEPEPSVLPGPASMRVRHDMAAVLEIPDAEQVGVDDDRVHFAVAPDRRGTSDPVPLGAIVLLKDDGTDISLEQVPPTDALRDLWFLSFNLPSDDDRARCFAQLADLASTVPVWNLVRPMRLDALADTVEALGEVMVSDG